MNFRLQKVNMVRDRKMLALYKKLDPRSCLKNCSWIKPSMYTAPHNWDLTTTFLHHAVRHDFILTHPQEVLPLRYVSPLVIEPQEGVKNEVPVRVVPPRPLPKQQPQSEGHKQPTIACSQAPAQLQTVKFQQLLSLCLSTTSNHGSKDCCLLGCECRMRYISPRMSLTSATVPFPGPSLYQNHCCAPSLLFYYEDGGAIFLRNGNYFSCSLTLSTYIFWTGWKIQTFKKRVPLFWVGPSDMLCRHVYIWLLRAWLGSRTILDVMVKKEISILLSEFSPWLLSPEWAPRTPESLKTILYSVTSRSVWNVSNQPSLLRIYTPWISSAINRNAH
jgi:hypothetical protein